jgi:hypothetical protein
MESRTQSLPRNNHRSRSAAKAIDLLPVTAKSNPPEKRDLPEREIPSRDTQHVIEGDRQNQSQFISNHAYRLWEKDGRPDGRDQEYWFRAEAEMKQG